MTDPDALIERALLLGRAVSVTMPALPGAQWRLAVTKKNLTSLAGISPAAEVRLSELEPRQKW